MTTLTWKDFEAAGIRLTGFNQEDVLANNGDKSTPILIGERLVVQLSGLATAVNLVMERHPANSVTVPATGSAHWKQSGNAIVGDPSAATFEPLEYSEPGIGWWRARLVTKTGASVTVNVSGRGKI